MLLILQGNFLADREEFVIPECFCRESRRGLLFSGPPTETFGGDIHFKIVETLRPLNNYPTRNLLLRDNYIIITLGDTP